MTNIPISYIIVYMNDYIQKYNYRTSKYQLSPADPQGVVFDFKNINYLIEELERVFNFCRLEYLKCIFNSRMAIAPRFFLRATKNRAYQSMASLNVYQGGTKHRKPNDYFWESQGFSLEAKKRAKFSEARKRLFIILKSLRKLDIKNYFSIYAELIAIKPGFHEIWLHQDYFDNEPMSFEDCNNSRDVIFNLIRYNASRKKILIKKLPRDINSQSYFSYASCAITEGPIVFRKDKSISYFEEIKKIKKKENKDRLKNNFIILDYQNTEINSRKQLKNFIDMALDYDIY